MGISAKLRVTAATLRDHARKTVSWLRAHPAWLWESRYFWFTILGAVGVPVVVLMWWPHEHIIRYAGLGLQLLGIYTVWWGIRETRKLFEHPTFWMKTRQWFRRRPKYGGRVIEAASTMASVSTASARLSVWNEGGSTLEQRVEALERNLSHVRDDLSGFQKKADEDIRKLHKNIKREQKVRNSEVQEILEKMEATETGGLHISAIGALWILVGVTMSTIPAELAGYVSR